MPRPTGLERFADIVATATGLFIERGYRRTRMVDVARQMGVTEPALYRYFEGKEALFDEVVRNSVGEPNGVGAGLPLANPAPGSTLEFLRGVVARESRIPALETALAAPSPPADAAAELRAVLGEMLASLERNRVGLKVLERAAADWPELATLWFGHARARAHGELAEFLARRGSQGKLRVLADPHASARLVLEVLAYAGMHRHTDPFPTPGDPQAFAPAAIDDLINAYLP